MCLLFFSYDMHPDYQLIVAANRDEFYDRPTRPLAFWNDRPAILAGRDLKNYGTWLGVTRSGRFAAITNFRDPASQKAIAPSRGLLVSNFLAGSESPPDYLARIHSAGHRFNGFNLLIGDDDGLYYFSNKRTGIQRLRPGVYGLSNHLLDTPWPKVEKGKAHLETFLTGQEDMDTEAIFGILGDRSWPADDQLPNTGVGLEWERVLAPLFITSRVYGTRSSSILLMEKTGSVTFMERTFAPADDKSDTRTFRFQI